MADYFSVKNQAILNPPGGVDLGSATNQYQTVYAASNLVVGSSAFTATTLGAPKISTIVYPGNDTAADTAGGQTITLTGSGFAAGAGVLINGVNVSVVTVVSNTTLTFVAPALATGSYVIYVVNADGSTAIAIPGIQYSGTPTWSTASGSLGSLYETQSFANTLTATGDAPVTYSVFSGTLPPGANLNANGTITGTSSTLASTTTYTFTVRASDAQNQDTDRTFSITVNPDVVTWSQPPSGNTYSVSADTLISNVDLSATSAIGYGIQYTANTLPTGLSLSGNTISGTPTAAGTVSTLLTATANTSSKSATRVINWVVTVAPSYWLYRMQLPTNGVPKYMRGVAADSSGNVFHLSVLATGQAHLSKINGTGSTILWQKTIAGTWTNESGGITIIPWRNNKGIVDSSGNFYHCGQSKRAGDSGRYGYVSKVSSAGDVDWTQYMGNIIDPSSSSYAGYFNSVSLDNTGNVIVSGKVNETGTLIRGMLAKYNSSGTLLWQKKVRNLYSYVDSYNYLTYSYIYDAMVSHVDSNNDIIVSTSVYPHGSNSADGIRGQTFKLDSSGNLLWSRKYRTDTQYGSGTLMPADSVTTDSSNDIYALYGSTSASTLGGGQIIKVSGSSGALLWNRVFYTSYSVYGPNYTRGTKILFANNHIYVAGYGYFSKQGGYGDPPSGLHGSYPRMFEWIIKFNTSGTVIWQRRIKPSNWYTGYNNYDNLDLHWRDNTLYLQRPHHQYQGNYSSGGYGDVTNNYYDSDIGVLKVPDDGSGTGTYTIGGLNWIYEASNFSIDQNTDSLIYDQGNSAGTIIVENSTFDNGAITPTTTNTSFTTSKTNIT